MQNGIWTRSVTFFLRLALLPAFEFGKIFVSLSFSLSGLCCSFHPAGNAIWLTHSLNLRYLLESQLCKILDYPSLTKHKIAGILRRVADYPLTWRGCCVFSLHECVTTDDWTFIFFIILQKLSSQAESNACVSQLKYVHIYLNGQELLWCSKNIESYTNERYCHSCKFTQVTCKRTFYTWKTNKYNIP